MNSEAFKIARKQLGLTVSGMADKLGFNRKSIRRMESGDQPVSPRTKLHVELLLSVHESGKSEPAALHTDKVS